MSYPEQTKEQFALRYYRFALADAQREVEQDLPLLRAIGSRSVLRLLEMLSPLEPDRQLFLLRALTKRFHTRALELLEEAPSPAESAAVADYLSSIRHPSRAEIEIDDREATTQRKLPSRAALRELAMRELEPVLGNDFEHWQGGVYRFAAPFEDWTVYTYVDLGGRYKQIAYSHDVVSAKETEPLCRFISFFSWLGISGQTDWSLVSEPDAQLAAKSLALACSLFFRAVPGLLEGLAPGA